MKVVIVGGVAGGASCAARLRRLDEKAEILMVERGPHGAFAARVLLVEAAEKAIDTQYYAWHDDVTGNLLYEALWRAAGRGVRVRLLVDDNSTAGLDPALDTRHRDDLLLLPRMLKLVGHPTESMDLVSPYFVPMAEGSGVFEDLAHSGVRVRVLTNSLTATDVTSVNAGYAKRRKALLEAGVQLFELKPTLSESPEKKGSGRELVGEPSREDFRHRRDEGIRRVLQLRPTLGPPQHRAGHGDRQPRPRRAHGRRLRFRGPPSRLRGPSLGGRSVVLGRAHRVGREAVRHRARGRLLPAGLGGVLSILPIEGEL